MEMAWHALVRRGSSCGGAIYSRILAPVQWVSAHCLCSGGSRSRLCSGRHQQGRVGGIVEVPSVVAGVNRRPGS